MVFWLIFVNLQITTILDFQVCFPSVWDFFQEKYSQIPLLTIDEGVLNFPYGSHNAFNFEENLY